MIKDKTVFILGAGASRPYGYPTGGELREKICKDFTNAHSLFKPGEPYWDARLDLAGQFTKRFFEAGANTSIDLFLARLNPTDKDKFTEIVKTAISFFILKAECDSKFDENMEREKREQDWYAPLLSKMISTLITHDIYERIEDNAVTFITFNYDRSLEYYIHRCFTSTFPDAPKEYLQKIGSEILKIHHVYGKIANLPWQSMAGDSLPYRQHNFTGYIDNTIKNIKTIYEMPESVKKDIQESLVEAQQIFFLGFGYAEENLKAMGIPEILKDGSRTTKIYGTAQGMHPKRISELNTMFNVYKDSVNIRHNMDCLQLLREYLL